MRFALVREFFEDFDVETWSFVRMAEQHENLLEIKRSRRKGREVHSGIVSKTGVECGSFFF